jgi:hydroxymethylpyrimidine pyrophosphatase-like HAD family hydrolase
MDLSDDIDQALKQFLEQSNFDRAGGVVTDLDGTALHEDQGRIYIPKPVELGFKHLHDLGRPFVLNTLRFPLSVLRTFGKAWYDVSNSPIPTVTLNGSLIGYVIEDERGEMSFEEIAAFPLTKSEIEGALDGVERILQDGFTEILLFYYPRDWRIGEVIWTPVPGRVLPVKTKYVSASSVTAVTLPKLRGQLLAEDICMMILLLDLPAEKRMAYQHTRRNNVVTRNGVDKLFGARQMAQYLRFELPSSIGAGDTELDSFLAGVGLAVIVGTFAVGWKGLLQTIRLNTSFELGELLFRAAGVLQEVRR